jgi:sigma-54 dependent transcriptional regulator, acetoin dehydrogenase operon transcriptional activator AcoR
VKIADDRVSVEQARQDFLTSGSVRGGVSGLVLASWRRSVGAGVSDPVNAQNIPYFDDLDLRSRFVHCALHVVERLEREMGDLPVSIVLTDQHSRLLVRRDSDRSLAGGWDAVSFAPGFTYAEDMVGTNAVGTALETGEAVFIRGPEHFWEGITAFACAGAPVRDPLTRRVQGVLDLSCLAKDSSPMMRVLVQEAARDIEAALRAEGTLSQQAVLDRFLQVSRTSRGPVLSLSGGVFMINARASGQLSPLDQGCLRETAAELLGARDGAVVDVDLPTGRVARVRTNLVTVGTKVAGTVIQVDLAAPSARARRTPAANPVSIAEVPGRSSAWRAVCGELQEFARAARPLILTGEPGTGKLTLVAATHRRMRPTVPMVTVDCRVSDPAPTARFREATEQERPTIVLAHLHELSDEYVEDLGHQLWSANQAKPGGWIVATMAATASAGHPQLDGVLRHFVGSVSVPALRHHIDDLHQLLPHLLRKLAPRRQVACTPGAMRVLLGYSWPGNITELRDVLRGALTRRPAGDLREADLPGKCFASSRRSLTPMEIVERDAIVRALVEAGGNRVKAAGILGIARSSLYRKIDAYGIRPLE